MNIVLTGMMGTGKSSVGKELAGMMGMKFIDTDEVIEQEAEKKISRIFSEDGEPVFREFECKAVNTVSALNNFVIATGGGAVKDPGNMDRLEKNSLVICLRAVPEVVIERTSAAGGRPLLDVEDPPGEIERIAAEREQYYKRCDFSVDTSYLTPAETASEIIKKMEVFRGYAD